MTMDLCLHFTFLVWMRRTASAWPWLYRLFIAKLPNVLTLEVHVAKCELSVKEGAVLQSLKAKCRELARSDSGVLVSPTNEALRTPFGAKPELTLWIVAKDGYLKNPKTSKCLSNLQFRLQHKVKLSHTILQTCYHFTLVARLAPKWNRVIAWLVQGCDFLTEGKGQGIDLQIGITNEDITVTLSVHKLSFSFMKVEDLLTTSSLLSTFNIDPQCVITEGSIYNNRCFLLPNFTVGYIYSASHFLPPGNEFQTYDQVRLHWKKQHGILLPEKENLFYQIFFKGNPRKFFSYPGSCVYKNKPIHYLSRDTDSVAGTFISDVHARLPSICGEQIKYSSRALTPYANLQQPTIAAQSHSNLKRLPPPSSQHTSRTPGTIPLNLRATPDPPRTITKLSTQQQTQMFTGARVVPIFKPKGAVATNKAAVVPQAKSKGPIVPKFKPTASTTQLLGKRAASSTIDATKKPCLEQPNLQQVPSLQQFQAHCTHIQPRPESQQRAPLQKSQMQQKLSAQSGVRPQTISKTSSNSTAVQPTHKSTLQMVPDMANLSANLLDPDDSDFVTNTASKKALSLKKTGTGQPEKAVSKQREGETTTLFTGVGPGLLKKINKSKAAILKKWLADNGVKYRSKEKKEDLVRIVVQHITSTGKSFEPST